MAKLPDYIMGRLRPRDGLRSKLAVSNRVSCVARDLRGWTYDSTPNCDLHKLTCGQSSPVQSSSSDRGTDSMRQLLGYRFSIWRR